MKKNQKTPEGLNRIGEINFTRHKNSIQDKERYEYLRKNFPIVLTKCKKLENGNEFLVFRLPSFSNSQNNRGA